MDGLRMEPLVRPDGKRDRTVISFRLYWDSVACIEAFAAEHNWTRSDALRHLITRAGAD